MRIDELLARDGLEAPVRLLVLALVAIWRGDWRRLAECAERGRALGQSRRDFEETLLQAVLFCGFPRVVTAFETLGEAWPASEPPRGGALPVAEQPAAGRALFAAIYGRNETAVHTMLRGYHAEFHDFVLEAAYGRVLTRPGLAPRVRELLAVSVLAAQEQMPQFVGHARGALHFGASRGELREVLVSALGDPARGDVAVDSWLRRV